MKKYAKLTFGIITISMIVAAAPSPAAIVINEVYLGRGGTGATYNHEYIELFNNSSVLTEVIGDYTIQYASATGVATVVIANIPSATTLAPLDYYVITNTSGGSNGVNVPNVDQAAVPAQSFNSAGGKLRLRNALSASIDFIGYGTANASEGAPAPTSGTSDLSIQRYPNGVDTDNNSPDFTSAIATPGTVNVPEPASLGMAAMTGLVVLARRRKANRK